MSADSSVKHATHLRIDWHVVRRAVLQAGGAGDGLPRSAFLAGGRRGAGALQRWRLLSGGFHQGHMVSRPGVQA